MLDADRAGGLLGTTAPGTTQPGSKSTQNVPRFGFAILYVRVMVKPPPVPHVS
jgi:hypothetical protein